MKKKTDKQTKDRMIHIRLDKETHKLLKIEAVHRDTTVQSLVEKLILKSVVNSETGNVR